MAREGLSSFTIDTDVWKPKVRGTQRLAWFDRTMASELLTFDPQLVVIEGYAYGKGNSAHQIGELGGIIRLTLHEQDSEWVEIAPSKLKKFVTGKGNAPKDSMMIEAYKRFKVDVPTSDECDAASLAIMGAVGKGWLNVELPKVNMEAVEGVEW
jgi:crossover junction endodeoxyribonuclease RuvC